MKLEAQNLLTPKERDRPMPGRTLYCSLFTTKLNSYCYRYSRKWKLDNYGYGGRLSLRYIYPAGIQCVTKPCPQKQPISISLTLSITKTQNRTQQTILLSFFGFFFPRDIYTVVFLRPKNLNLSINNPKSKFYVKNWKITEHFVSFCSGF